jgi:lysophospholipase L1-like esterase
MNATFMRLRHERGIHVVSEVSASFLPPWSGKFGSDCFHPSQDGYRDWARALLTTLASTPVRSG